MYDFKTKLSALGVVKRVLGSNTYSVDCGRGPQHVSGDALSRSRLDSEDFTGEPRLTAQDLVQEMVQQDSDDTGADVDSSSDDDDYAQDVVPAAVVRRRRRVRQQDLGPICPTRLRRRN